MARSSDRLDRTALVPVARRSYALAKTPEAALELLRAPSNPPVLARDEAKQFKGREPFIVLDPDGFTIHKPWAGRLITPEGVSTDELAIGPAVRGRLVPTPRGSRLDIRVERYAPTPAERLKMTATLAGFAAVCVAMIIGAAGHPIILGLVGVSALGVLSSVLFFRHQQRSQDIKDLLAIVERTFGPLELPETEGSPHRDG